METDTKEDTEDVENFQEWTKKKLRGFRRVDPTKPPKQQRTNPSNRSQTKADVHPPPTPKA